MGKLSQLDDDAVVAEIGRVLGAQRRLTARLLECLIEVEDRRLHWRAACSSMFEYCVRRLGMSEGEAFRRIAAARLARRFPVILERVERGAIHLSALVLLRKYLTEQNHAALLDAASGKTKSAVQELIAARFPRPDAPTVLRKLPARRAHRTAGTPPNRGPSSDPAPMESGRTQSSLAAAEADRGDRGDTTAISQPTRSAEAHGPGSSQATRSAQGLGQGSSQSTHRMAASTPEPGAGAADALGSSPATSESAPTAALGLLPATSESRPTAALGSPPATSESRPTATLGSPQRRPARVEPLSPARFKLELTMDQAMKEKLERARDLLSHAVPDRDIVRVLDRALDTLLLDLEKTRLARTKRPRRSAASVQAASVQAASVQAASVQAASPSRASAPVATTLAASTSSESARMVSGHVAAGPAALTSRASAPVATTLAASTSSESALTVSGHVAAGPAALASRASAPVATTLAASPSSAPALAVSAAGQAAPKTAASTSRAPAPVAAARAASALTASAVAGPLPAASAVAEPVPAASDPVVGGFASAVAGPLPAASEPGVAGLAASAVAGPVLAASGSGVGGVAVSAAAGPVLAASDPVVAGLGASAPLAAAPVSSTQPPEGAASGPIGSAPIASTRDGGGGSTSKKGRGGHGSGGCGAIRREIRREVFARDGEQCTFVDAKGRRCQARAFLELDHIVSRAVGGSGEAANVRVRCRAHNQWHAEQTFGKGYVGRRVEQGREAQRGPRAKRGPEREAGTGDLRQRKCTA